MGLTHAHPYSLQEEVELLLGRANSIIFVCFEIPLAGWVSKKTRQKEEPKKGKLYSLKLQVMTSPLK